MSPSSIRTTLVPLIIACALFMEHLDSSIIATALPAIAQSLHTDPLRLNLAITSYLFSLAIFIPLSGWIADRFGARTVFRAAIVVFMIGSIACGFSGNLPELITARIIQGMGGAMMVPVGRLMLLRTVSRSELVSAMAWLSAPALVGPVLGPPAGGFIVTYASWRWIFFVNIPIGILGFVLASIFIENIRAEKHEPLDMRGFALMAACLSGLVIGFETVGRHLVPVGATLASIVVGLASFGAYAWHGRRHQQPIIDLGLMKYRTYATSVIGGSLFRMSIGALPFLLPMMLQVGFGLSPATSGLLTFSSAAGAIAMKLFATPVIRALGFRKVLTINACINTCFLAGCAFFQPQTLHIVIFFFLLLGGFFRSLQFTSLNALAYAEIPAAKLSRANTFYSMMQQLSLSLGVATGALFLNMTLAFHGKAHLEAYDFWPSFIGIGLLSLSSLFFFLPLAPHAGAEISGHRIKRPRVEHEDPS